MRWVRAENYHRVALLLSNHIYYQLVVQQTSSLVYDIVGALQRRSMDWPKRDSWRPTAESARLTFKMPGYWTQADEILCSSWVPSSASPRCVLYTQQRDSQTGTVKQVAVQDTFQRILWRPLLRGNGEDNGVRKEAQWLKQSGWHRCFPHWALCSSSLV